MQTAEIADSVSLFTSCTAIFAFYTAKAVHEQEAKRIANVAWRRLWRKPNTEECGAFRGGLKGILTNKLICHKIEPPKRWFYFAQNEVILCQKKEKSYKYK